MTRAHLQCHYKTKIEPFTPSAETKLLVHVREAMSKIFDVLRRAGLLRSTRKDTKTVGASAIRLSDRRMTRRIYVDIPLFIYGYTPDGSPFYEETCTIAINEGGGLISVTSGVQAGQPLVVTNEGNEQTQECVVVSVEAQHTHGCHVAFKFPTPMPQFWRELEIGKSRVS